MRFLSRVWWILGRLTPWVDGVEESDGSLVHVNGTQDEEVIVEVARFEDFLHFKTTST